MTRLEDCARKGEVVVLAGAGLSAAHPSALPGWKPLNAAILRALCSRLEAALQWPSTRLTQWVSLIDAERGADRFPPDYQAQVIEEMCGERYFHALQALDVDVPNQGHEGISALAATGALKAVLTTNFDRLIEQALERRGVDCAAVYDAEGFAAMSERLRAGKRGPLPVIKIHGCVSAHMSMIDTLKQRKRGRARQLQECLEALQSWYWLYLGFSAADLETDPDYLGLVGGAAGSAGATYVAFPGKPGLGKGARLLMDAYGAKGETAIADVAAYLGKLCTAVEATLPAEVAANGSTGLERFQLKLQAWADSLPPAAAGLCLAAVLEAVGQDEGAVRVLDRLVRKALYDERNTEDFRALQLHYGRLGAAWGRFIAVQDIQGAAANASVETVQSLLRILNSEAGFAASAWLACLYLWLGNGLEATKISYRLLRGFHEGRWEGRVPRRDEEALDAWISAVQVCVLNEHQTTIVLVAGTFAAARKRAKRTGDVVRGARIAALFLLALGKTTEDVPKRADEYQSEFDEAARVGDAFALGMRSLALGRWHVGPGGLELGSRIGQDTVAVRALEHLRQAASFFEKQGMHPWVLYSLVQQAKAYGDLHQFDDAQQCLDDAVRGLERFPILSAHVYEAAGQLRQMHGAPDAEQSFEAAVQVAEKCGLLAMREGLLTYLKRK